MNNYITHSLLGIFLLGFFHFAQAQTPQLFTPSGAVNGTTTSTGVGIGTDKPDAALGIIPSQPLGFPAFKIVASDSLSPGGYQLSILGATAGNGAPHTQITTNSASSRMTLICASPTDKAPRLQMTGPNDASQNQGWAIFDYGSREVDLPTASFKMRHQSFSAGNALDMIHADGRNGVYLAPSQGNVGIGTSSPASLLDVNGDIRSESLVGGGWVRSTANGVLELTTLDLSLNDLSDLNVASPSGGDILLYNGASWAPISLASVTTPPAGVAFSLGADTLGAGSKFMFTPSKSSFRAGYVNGSNWDYNNQGEYSTAFGDDTYAPGDWSLAAGRETESAGNYSTALGSFTQTTSHALAIGKWNIDTGTTTSWNTSDYVFTIGDGSVSGRSNALWVQKNGDMWIQGNFTQNSDRRLKENIQSLDNSLENLAALNGVTYQWKNREQMGDRVELGLIAQDIETVYPELIREVEGYKSVNYIGLIPVLVEAIKEEKAARETETQTLQAENNLLHAELDMMKSELAAIKTQLGINQQVTTSPKADAKLAQNQPNPFSSSTDIQYYIPQEAQQASIQITTLEGKLIRNIAIEGTGYGSISIEGGSLSAGTYLYTLMLNGKAHTSHRMILTK